MDKQTLEYINQAKDLLTLAEGGKARALFGPDYYDAQALLIKQAKEWLELAVNPAKSVRD
jgi:hypothetical protein